MKFDKYETLIRDIVIALPITEEHVREFMESFWEGGSEEIEILLDKKILDRKFGRKSRRRFQVNYDFAIEVLRKELNRCFDKPGKEAGERFYELGKAMLLLDKNSDKGR